MPLSFPHLIRRSSLLHFALAASLAWSANLAKAGETHVDLEYAKVDNSTLYVDLYLPSTQGKAPLIVYLHGGAWRAGNRKDVPVKPFVEKGYAVASVEYRLSTQAPFPAQIYDVKAAIRFLRAKADSYHLDANRFIVAGSSAGGHLAAEVAVANGNKELEGSEGEYLSQSSDVQACVTYFGASNLQTLLSQSSEQTQKMRKPALQFLLGGQPDEKPELAQLASPVAHVSASSPPMIWLHGDQDPQMPPPQADEMKAAYEKAGRPFKLVLIPGAKHGGKVFYDAEHVEMVQQFLDANLPAK